MATIKPIEARSVHQIQSGQVIVDLCSVVKELIENSLDAGATTIEVRFKNQGLDTIEIQDNGSGISKENYETLALKHYTSKLSSYEDLAKLQTFGFRGEALSSLCALSKFTVTTCLACDSPKGSKLDFETSGKLRSTSMVASQKGTTVSVETLFYNLPVRRRELERNIKREWNKVIGVLNQYACIQTGVKFTVSHQPTKGKKMVLFSTKGNKTTRENIVNVFGSKTLSVLIPLELELELEPTTSSSLKMPMHAAELCKEIRVQGHVSRPAHGEGRQTPDRQMFFVNSRPCGLPQFAKVFNEVYKSYNTSQSPFIFADIQLDTHLYDVNVSPDKRTILLHDQSRMLENLREALVSLFESQNYAMPMSQLSINKFTPYKKPSISEFLNTAKPSNNSSSSATHEIRPSAENATIGNEMSAEDRLNDVRDKAQQDEDDDGATEALRSSSTDDGDNDQSARRSPNLEHDSAQSHYCSFEAAGSNVAALNENEEQSSPKEDAEDNDDASQMNAEPSRTAITTSESERRSGQIYNENSAFSATLSWADRKALDPPIPAIFTPSRTTDTKPTAPSSSRSLKRSAPEIATVTIGDETVTSIVGATPKRPRVARDRASQGPSTRSSKKSVPSFKGRLTQMFSAHSTSGRGQSSSLEVDGDEVDDEESVRSESVPESDSESDGIFVDAEDNEEAYDEVDQKAVESDRVEESDAASAIDPQREEDMRDAEAAEDVATQPSQVSSSADDVDESNNRDLQEDQGTPRPVQMEAETGPALNHGNLPEETQKRTQLFIKGGTKKKDATYQLQQTLRLDTGIVQEAMTASLGMQPLSSAGDAQARTLVTDELDAEDAEEKLSLTISKSDFFKMKIIGQFNLGFILAARPRQVLPIGGGSFDGYAADDELFIIDQHATDEKYNFERLQSSTVVQSQRLVQPKQLELTALEEEVIKENIEALEANGFMVSVDDSGEEPVGSRCRLLSLPLSRETTFSLSDLEELISLLTEHHYDTTPTAGGTERDAQRRSKNIPRPAKVRKMFAMRACRSSVMIGRPLTKGQMTRLVRHMGEIDKPWNCPHGRPTMRHLCGLSAWDEAGWREGDGFDFGSSGGAGANRAQPMTDWTAYLQGRSGHGDGVEDSE